MPLLPGPIRRGLAALHRPIYESRLRELTRRIVPHLRPSDAVLDVGCGVGVLSSSLLQHPDCPQGVRIEGLERAPRGGEPIPVHSYGGGEFPFEDNAYDIVILADVLHHDANPDRLLRECVRVASRLLIVKDHQVRGVAAQRRIAFMDWAANAPYGVPCLYRYNRPAEWAELPGRLGVRTEQEATSMNLYPPIVNAVFGRGLQYFAIYGTGEAARHTPDEASEAI